MIRAWMGESGILLEGHAGYAPEGQDIVCSAATMLAYALAVQLEKEGLLAEWKMDKGKCMVFTEDPERAKPWMEMARTGFELLAKNFPVFFRVGG